MFRSLLAPVQFDPTKQLINISIKIQYKIYHWNVTISFSDTDNNNNEIFLDLFRFDCNNFVYMSL